MQNKPLSPWKYFGLEILYSIPIIGFIFLIVHSFSDNINRRNFARSYWCVYILIAIFIGLLIFTGGSAVLLTTLKNLH